MTDIRHLSLIFNDKQASPNRGGSDTCTVVLNDGVYGRFRYFTLGHRGTGEMKLVHGPADQEDGMWFVMSRGSATDAWALTRAAQAGPADFHNLYSSRGSTPC